ncbi:glycerophosphocholine phosphodiesterase GPCPD1-like isoform X2 [Photinus pyralis]|uniref:glycerophosphocholine phosphodiesterase GPCPD1-like isoform X2 n=1 Tax=Photinus pyralis TaxID=7054 RepID=UPI0012670A87|nr:glycerophosphocholine phosphodiesterase GPCPD1-like isoform X2 [Photinus pyralis]
MRKMTTSAKMQRWFFLEDPENAEKRRVLTEDELEQLQRDQEAVKYRPWLFRVRVPDLKSGETVCVTGNVKNLGGWDPNRCIALDQEEESEVWSKVISVPDKQKVYYRYCICVVIESGLQVIVRNWEANLDARIIESRGLSPMNSDEPCSYGDYNNMCRSDRGWITKETVVQFKIFNPPSLWRPRYVNRPVFIKITPVNLTRYSLNSPTSMAEALEESVSTDNDSLERPRYAFTEVASLSKGDDRFQPQEQFGKEFKGGDGLIFQSTVLFPHNVAFLIDIYVFSSRAGDNEPPYHAGFSYLLPSALQSSVGSSVLPVTSTKHRPLGQIELEYLVVRPGMNFKCDMEVSYTRHWKNSWCGLDVGHRGSGSSFKIEPKNCAEVRENTLASLKVAIEHGADFVEFDVQLSKDLVPIIYHDFHVCIAMKRKKQLEDSDMLELPLKDLTLEQLRLLKVYHLSEGKTKNPRFFDDDLEDHQPFPTLQQLLEVLDPHVGFNVEIKWTMQLHDGSYELKDPVDINTYVDTILEVVIKHAGNRKIIFSSFNADVCTMLRLKQNKYPIIFLTVGQSVKYPQYHDPRCFSIETAVHHAVMSELLGINVHTEDILRDPSQVKLATTAGLIIFCWGDENADKATIKYLKELGLHGIIYDKIDQYSSKEVKESIFLVEARESQKELIRLAAVAAEQPSSPPPILKECILDVEKARVGLENESTATSLQSLESIMPEQNHVIAQEHTTAFKVTWKPTEEHCWLIS